MAEPISIRSKNPGAMWPGKVATKFGSTEWWPCAGNNKCAVFPTFEQGAAAQFYLWANNYSNMTLDAAIHKWSGHNSSAAYAKFMQKRIPSLTMETYITKAFLQSETGLEFMKAQAWWEAGKKYPMTDEQWRKGQELAFGKAKPARDVVVQPKPMVKSKNFWASILAGASTALAYVTDWKVLAVLAVAALIAFVIWDRKGKPDITGWFK